MEFANKELSKASSSVDFINIYDVDSEETLNQAERTTVSRKPSKRKSAAAKKELSYIEVNDLSNSGHVELVGPVCVSNLQEELLNVS